MTADTTEIRDDLLDPSRAAALHATLGLPGDPPGTGDTLPPFWHHIHFWTALPPASLGRDGHPARGGLVPDFGLPRRMWAGGRVRWHEPLVLGRPARRTSRLEAAGMRDGRSGRFALVTLRHEITQDGALCLTEWQDLVYRPDPVPGAAAPVPAMAPTDESVRIEITFGSTDLFRYSALTFNGHRIHYDLDYARGVEGYPGLVVHGPLLALKLAALARTEMGTTGEFSYRATAPGFAGEQVAFCARAGTDGLILWARGADGRLCMSAQASP